MSDLPKFSYAKPWRHPISCVKVRLIADVILESDTVFFASVGVQMSMSDIYEGVAIDTEKNSELNLTVKEWLKVYLSEPNIIKQNASQLAISN